MRLSSRFGIGICDYDSDDEEMRSYVWELKPPCHVPETLPWLADGSAPLREKMMWTHDFCQGDATSEGDASFYDCASKKVDDGVPRNEIMRLILSFRLPPKLKLPWLARTFASGEEWRAEFGNGTYDKTDGY